MTDHNWQNCEDCRRHVMRYGESYFDPDTGWHPLPVRIFQMKGGGWAYVQSNILTTRDTDVMVLDRDSGQESLDNLHRLKDGEVVLCWLLN